MRNRFSSTSPSPAHRRNPRARILLRTAILLVCLGIAGYLITANISRPKPPALQVSVEQPTPPPLRRIVTYIVRPGDTFAGILEKLGLSTAQAHASYASLKPHGLSALFPGDSVRLGFTPEGVPDSLSLLIRMQNWYHVTFAGNQPLSRREAVTISRTRHLVRGELTRSLSEDMNALGVGDAMTTAFADVFAWDINFFTDPRRGDRFEVLYEMLHAEGRFLGFGSILAATYGTSGKTFHAIALADTENGMRLSYYDLAGKALQKQFLKAPLRFSRISSRYTTHRRHPILGTVRPHLGVDYAAPMGTPVYSAADGTVASASYEGGFGRVIRINHGGTYQTTYGHLSAFAKGIHSRAHVRQGDLIGYVGSSGLSTGPHLDYRMRMGTRFVNPQTISLPSKAGVDMKEMPRFLQVRDSLVARMRDEHPGENGCWEIVPAMRPVVRIEALE